MSTAQTPGGVGGLQLRAVSGAALARHVPALARLRIRVFRDFPYLYQGSADYEATYLQTYVECPQAVIVLALDGDRVVGASSGLPLAAEEAAFVRPFQAAGLDPQRFFYCAESVLLPAYRGRGVGRAFFTRREAHARALGGLDALTFCAVERPPDHPARPAGYRPLDAFWRSLGFRRRPELVARYAWCDVGQACETEKPMVFWTRALDGAEETRP